MERKKERKKRKERKTERKTVRKSGGWTGRLDRKKREGEGKKRSE